ncbi:MAG TPA: prolyl oligopeptidase family serine peptidase [Streptosporangiaceae bacterium]
MLSLDTQFWTSRGFALVEVNYPGSTGYGRRYRELLNGRWGIADVVDRFAAARSLAERGQVAPARMCIRGGSAGGFATLRALARQDTPFAVGADYYRLVNLEVIARETHKCEGVEDEIVPPDQAEMIVQALQSKGVPVAYLPLENAQHGFRRAENISRMLDAELSFYAQLFALVLPAAEEIEPVAIEGFPTRHEKGGQSPA